MRKRKISPGKWTKLCRIVARKREELSYQKYKDFLDIRRNGGRKTYSELVFLTYLYFKMNNIKVQDPPGFGDNLGTDPLDQNTYNMLRYMYEEM